jgi:hypothetical protein
VINGSTGGAIALLSLQGPAQAIVADSTRGVAYLIAQDPYTLCSYCAQYNYDMVVINGTTANNGYSIGITSTTTLIEGSPYSSGITHSSLAIDPHTGKVVLADAVDTYFSLYNPAVPSYEAVDHVNLGWIPNAVTIDTANSIAYLTDSQYNNVQAIGLATVLANTAYGWSYNLFSGTQGSNNCGFLSNAVVPDPTTGEVYIITCTVNTTSIEQPLRSSTCSNTPASLSAAPLLRLPSPAATVLRPARHSIPITCLLTRHRTTAFTITHIRSMSIPRTILCMWKLRGRCDRQRYSRLQRPLSLPRRVPSRPSIPPPLPSPTPGWVCLRHRKP